MMSGWMSFVLNLIPGNSIYNLSVINVWQAISLLATCRIYLEFPDSTGIKTSGTSVLL